MSAVPWWADDDPWAMSPDEQAAFDAAERKRRDDTAALSDTPPF